MGFFAFLKRMRVFYQNRYAYLLLSLGLMLLVHPYIEGYQQFNHILMNLILIGLTFSVVYALNERGQKISLFFWLVVPIIVVHIINIIRWDMTLLPIEILLFALMLTISAWLILSHILKDRVITANTINGAICVYLLIGFAFAAIYSLLEYLVPGSFFFSETHMSGNIFRMENFVYYSFITLSTLGYGDIVPVSPQARSLIVIETLLGQLYLVVLVARLVGMYNHFQLRQPEHPLSSVNEPTEKVTE
jgi:hypothetical protein